jgi:riboflavin synthase
MFTGLIDHVGTISAVGRDDAGLTLDVACSWPDVVAGESIAVNGACLTVLRARPGQFSVAAMLPTVERTTIGTWGVGRKVNLERALRVNDRLGGHIVQGHVDCVGVVSASERRDDALILTVGLQDDVWQLMVPRGSVALDGVSLTVSAVQTPGTVSVSLIEYTVSHTTLGMLAAGDRVHVEADVIGKYVQRLVAPWIGMRGTGNTD